MEPFIKVKEVELVEDIINIEGIIMVDEAAMVIIIANKVKANRTIRAIKTIMVIMEWFDFINLAFVFIIITYFYSVQIYFK
jgi:hypothetical protein